MFLWENYLNKGKFLIKEEELSFSESERRKLFDYQRANRNWISQALGMESHDMISAILVTPVEDYDIMFDHYLRGLVQRIVDDTLFDLKVSSELGVDRLTLDKIFDEMKKIRKIFIDDAGDLLGKVDRNSFKTISEIAKKDFTNLIKKPDISYSEFLSIASDVTEFFEVENEIISTLVGEKYNIEEGKAIIAGVVAGELFLKAVEKSSNPTLPVRSSLSVIALFAKGKQENKRGPDIAAGLVNVFLGTKISEPINMYSTVFTEYSKFSEKLSADISRFIQIINANISPNKQQTEVTTIPQGRPDLIFLESTYRATDEMKKENQNLYNFATAAKKNEMSEQMMAYKTLSTPIKKGGLIRTILGGLANLIIDPNMVKTGEKYKEAQLEKRKIFGEEYAQRAQMYRTEIEMYMADRLMNLTKIMKNIFVAEAMREYSNNDPNVLEAWKLLSEFDTFIVDINKWVSAFQFEETIQQAKKEIDQSKSDLEQTKIANETIKTKGKAKEKQTDVMNVVNPEKNKVAQKTINLTNPNAQERSNLSDEIRNSYSNPGTKYKDLLNTSYKINIKGFKFISEKTK